MKYYSKTGRRNNGRPLKRLVESWDRNGSTSGPTPWKIHYMTSFFLFQITSTPNDVLFSINVSKYFIFLNISLCFKNFISFLHQKYTLTGVLRNFSFSRKGYTDIKRLKTTEMSDSLQMDQIQAQWRAHISTEINLTNCGEFLEYSNSYQLV
jgi:hypothetical protein